MRTIALIAAIGLAALPVATLAQQDRATIAGADQRPGIQEQSSAEQSAAEKAKEEARQRELLVSDYEDTRRQRMAATEAPDSLLDLLEGRRAENRF